MGREFVIVTCVGEDDGDDKLCSLQNEFLGSGAEFNECSKKVFGIRIDGRSSYDSKIFHQLA